MLGHGAGNSNASCGQVPLPGSSPGTIQVWRAGDRSDLTGQPGGAPLVPIKDARDLLAERLHPADPSRLGPLGQPVAHDSASAWGELDHPVTDI
jgi:hypothetical protein